MALEFHPVLKPKHYNNHPSGIECIEITEELTFNLGNAFKYLFRFDEKENPKQDVEKSVWYLDRELLRSERFKNYSNFDFIKEFEYQKYLVEIGYKTKLHLIEKHDPDKKRGSLLYSLGSVLFASSPIDIILTTRNKALLFLKEFDK